ncbi:GxxExxY protein [Candidatus Uhrbacteria bacterium]|nr:GxxExxY protein [Candidatus Uhrbacteria bacterium]
MESTLIYQELTYALNGIFFEVHNTLGRYCNEQQYADAIEQHPKQRGIPYERERILEPAFDGERPRRHRVDFLVKGAIVIEVKAKRMVGREEYIQTLRYLTALDCKLGMIVNFRQHLLVPKRVINPKASVNGIHVSASSV